MNDFTQNLTLQIGNEDVALTAADERMNALTKALREADNTKNLYEDLMRLNTEVISQRTEIHKLLQLYKTYRLSNVNEATKLVVKNRISFLNDKSLHLTEIRNDMSVLQRMLHSQGVY